jgi:hypothetical protein
MKINQGMDHLRPWAKLEEEWYKVNVDAASHSATGRMGLGVIVRVVSRPTQCFSGLRRNF